MRQDDATRAQVRAAAPDTSTWLAANAGSGKTRVLTDRVARLLLGGVPPEKILCLTYTKAAASEMQNRLFERLGQWAMMENAQLRETLDQLGADQALTPDTLARARSLFAQALETPGGLKIQTIHAFCAAILRRFPLEARVSPQFKEMEDRTGALLRARIVQDMASGPEEAIVARLARHLSDPDFDTITQAIVRARERFGADQDTINALFNLDAGQTQQDILSRVFLGGEIALIAELIPLLQASGGNDAKAADKLAALSEPGLVAMEILEATLLTGSGAKAPFTAKIGTFPKKALRNGAAAHLMDALEDLMRRVEDTREQRLAFLAAAKTRDLHAFADVFLPRFASAKAARGWLDFDDLILKTRDLLTDPAVAAWVLYRLDGGIDHILVDEAQDTSPLQWQVIQSLASEFTSGEGARSDVARTIFVVGDKKQSIYSFQGADPSGFDRMRDDFAQKLATIDAPFQDAALQFSFRSARAILDLVDVTFEGRAPSGFPPGIRHQAFKSDMGGRVDLWPLIPKAEATAARHWTDTVDVIDDTHHDVRLAERIADQIKDMLDGSEALPVKAGDNWGGRRIEPRDILILVQRRSTLFEEIIRACKNAELPIAGADRLKVGAELAVRDLGALLSWLALPEDDLALATVLKSPLFGWDEQALFTLCHARKEPFLWRTLEARKDQHEQTWNMLRDLRDMSDYLRPYDLIERVLIRHGGRARLLARLGPEAEDGINALLEQAISYESSETPSLTGFLLWMETDDLEIKRQPDAASNQIRVMTVHGSKGLEAPIVILPDCAKRDLRVQDSILAEPGVPVWKVNAETQPQVMAPWIEAERARQAQERDRLLYVAMTRAENWLIVAAAGDIDKEREAWHARVETAMTSSGAVLHHVAELGEGLRLQSGHWPAEAPSREEIARETIPPDPPWLRTKAPDARAAVDILTPTGLGGAKALPGEAGQDEEAALAHGTEVHHWLETLGDGGSAPDRATPALREAQQVRAAPHLAHVFAPGTLSEVPISAPVPSLGQRMRGTIDRLIITDAAIWAVDFKTNATVPSDAAAVPEGILRQMGSYAHMLAEVYPGRDIRTAILWTRTASLMELPHDLVTQALQRTTLP